MRRGVELVQVDAEAGAEIPLLVEVNGECPVSRPGKADGEVQGDRRLSAAALRIGKGNDTGHGFQASLMLGLGAAELVAQASQPGWLLPRHLTWPRRVPSRHRCSRTSSEE